ncbi:metal-dependent hydrolase [Gordonia sp. PDNC005]|uniref:metal-dependent hydrolase n=1 Tax=unclassified Gordonia (in: high G+C Gram-positive bacteria) TaxID=2657482 RepID=UPI0019624CC3|nr:metal-dependent hydrolase [Gordonia sp. PDNC005]QRY62043.1 metal-dependent hydrolase [Gordonia sp. PDNC005]
MTAVHANRSTPETDPGEVELHARNVAFDLSKTPLHWIPGAPVSSNMITVLNLLLPEGERWFVETFNEALPMIKDEKLATAMRGFVGQEAMHAEVHDKAVENWLTRHGVDATGYIEQMEWIFRKVLGPRQGQTPEQDLKHLIERLWLIAAIEHYTALLGDFALNSTWVENGADPNMADMFVWHGAEEVEHRAVAHDAAAYFGDTPLRRGRAMALAMPFLAILLVRGFRFINSQDPLYDDMSVPAKYRKYVKDYFVESRRGLFPKIGGLVWATATYFKPGFHPNDIGDTAQAVAYLASSPGARRAG